MTPAQLNYLSSVHAQIHNPEKYPDKSRGSRSVTQVDPDDDRTPAILASIASMKIPRKK